MAKSKRNHRSSTTTNGAPPRAAAGQPLEELRRQILAVTQELDTYREETRAQTEQLIKAQTLLEKSRDRYADLFDFAPTPYLVLDQWGVVIESNLPATALFEYERIKMVGFPLRRFVHEDDRRVFLSHMYRCRRETGRIRTEMRLVSGTGKLVPAELTSRRAIEYAEETALYPTAVTDLSERQQAAAVRNELLAHLVAAEEKERYRLSRELHDVLGQHITALILGLRALSSEVHQSANQKIEGLLSIADALGQDAHRLALNLRPTALDDLGLPSALGSYIEDWSARIGIPAEYHCRGASHARLPPHVETMFYRVAQEGLTNIAKHARARRVHVLLNVDVAEASLILEDDGCGLDAQLVFETAARANRLGLFGMRERVMLSGGTLEIESAPQKGTTLFVRVPLKKRQKEGAS